MFTLVDLGRFAKAAEWYDVEPTGTKVTVTHEGDNFPDVPGNFMELKIDPPVTGTHTYDNGAITLTFYGGDNGISQVNFSSTKPIYYVFVKGGEGGGGNLYKFDPYATGCKGLYANEKNGKYQNISHVTIYYKDEILVDKGNIKVIKKVQIGNDEPTAPGDVKFTFTLWQNNKEIRRGETGADGILVFDNLPTGKYILKEESRTGYTSDIGANGVELTVVKDKTTEKQVINYKEPEIEPKGNIKVIKKVQIGNNGPTAPGDVKFTFTLWQNDKEIRKGQTGADGILVFDNLPTGKYILKEESKAGYTSDIGANGVELTVVKDKTTEKQVINYKEPEVEPKGNIKVIKKVQIGNHEPTAPGDVKFTFELYKDGKLIASGETNPEGIIEMTGLSVGKYILKEKEKKGYLSGIAKDGVVVIVEKDKTTEVRVVNTKIEDKEQFGSIKIVKKVKTGNNNPTKPGDVKFTFNLLKDGKIIKTGSTDSEGILTFDNLPIGEYVLQEAASDKYTTSLNSSNNKITVKVNETTTVEVINTLKQTDEDSDEDEDLPNTGGFAETELLLAAAGAVIILLGIRLRRVRQ